MVLQEVYSFSDPWMSTLPFELKQDRRCPVPNQKHKVTNWRAYDANLRRCGSLTIWIKDVAIEGWRAQPRMTPDGQLWYSPLPSLTVLTLKAVFHLALRQAEGLIGSVIGLFALGALGSAITDTAVMT